MPVFVAKAAAVASAVTASGPSTTTRTGHPVRGRAASSDVRVMVISPRIQARPGKGIPCGSLRPAPLRPGPGPAPPPGGAHGDAPCGTRNRRDRHGGRMPPARVAHAGVCRAGPNYPPTETIEERDHAAHQQGNAAGPCGARPRAPHHAKAARPPPRSAWPRRRSGSARTASRARATEWHRIDGLWRRRQGGRGDGEKGRHGAGRGPPRGPRLQGQRRRRAPGDGESWWPVPRAWST